MIDKRILRLTPEQFFCPFCGDWHDWEGKTLQSYDDVLNTYEYECGDTRIEFWSGRLYGERDYIGRNYIGREHSGRDFIGVIVSTRCTKVCNNSIPKCFLDEIEYDDDESVIKFSTTLSTTGEISSSGECEHCEHCDECNLPNIGDERDDDEDEDEFKLTLEFKFKFSKREEEELKQQQELERQREEELKQQQELERQREEELKQKQELERQREAEFKKQHAEEPCINKTTQIKEDSTMANNLFNMNMEFGPNKDNNIASTLMGIAVKNGESWRIYDKKKKEITDVGDMQFGNLPIFIQPTTKLAEGDLIKDAGEYYFVMKVETGSTQTLCAKTGEMKTVIPIKNVLGFSCYSKVIALSDSFNMGGNFDAEKLAIMSAMCGQTGENGEQNASMNQLLPLMLFKDELGGDDDMMKMMLMSSMMTAPAKGNPNASMNQLLPLMLFKDEDDDDDDMMKMLLMSSMMGGNNDLGSNNMMMNYLMLNTFMGKKEAQIQKTVVQQEPGSSWNPDEE